MLTFSERAAITAIWALLLVGVYFAGRAAWRRWRQPGKVKDKDLGSH